MEYHINHTYLERFRVKKPAVPYAQEQDPPALAAEPEAPYGKGSKPLDVVEEADE